MYRSHTIGVVVPAYNEAGFVGEVVETVPEYVDRVYVIDDGSTDDTWTEIQTAAARVNEQSSPERPEFDQRVVPIRHDENRGVGGAIKTGYQRAMRDRIDITAVMGGDGQMRPDDLGVYLDPIVDGQADYTKGNRLREADGRTEMPRFRQVGNYLLSGLTKIASGYWTVSDPQNGYTAISLRALETIELDDLYEFYGYCNELLVRLRINGLRVADIPRSGTYADEESHIDYTTYIPRVSGMLLRTFLWRLREQYLRGRFHPAAICYTIGMGTGLLGSVLAVLEARSGGMDSRGVRNAVWTTLLGAVVFVLGTAFERVEAGSPHQPGHPEPEAMANAGRDRAPESDSTDSGANVTGNGARTTETEPP